MVFEDKVWFISCFRSAALSQCPRTHAHMHPANNDAVCYCCMHVRCKHRVSSRTRWRQRTRRLPSAAARVPLPCPRRCQRPLSLPSAHLQPTRARSASPQPQTERQQRHAGRAPPAPSPSRCVCACVCVVVALLFIVVPSCQQRTALPCPLSLSCLCCCCCGRSLLWRCSDARRTLTTTPTQHAATHPSHGAAHRRL